MKKSILLLLFFSIATISIQAQITINSDDVIAVGFVADQTTDSLPDASILEGGVGNINWDFSQLNTGGSGQYVFFDPALTPYAASYPTANLASEVEAGLFAYMTKDNDKIEIIGLEGTQTVAGVDIEGKLDVTPGQSLIRFPATFGDSYDETVVQQGQVTGASVGFPTFDSVRLVITVNRMVEIDAYGTMDIPSGSFETIRSSETETSLTEVLVLSNNIWNPLGNVEADTVINYNWWTLDNGIAFPVVQLIYDPISDSRTVIWLTGLTDTENLFKTEAKLFPNPTVDYVTVEFEQPFDGRIAIYNLDGQLLQEQNSFNSIRHRMNVSHLNSGTYILLLRNMEGKTVGQQKVIISN